MDVEHVKTMISGVGESIDCDADWMPTLLIEAKGGVTVVGMPVDMVTQLDRDMVAAIIKGLLKRSNATGGVWITTAWSVDSRGMTKDELDEQMELAKAHRLNTSARKVEVVVAIVAHRSADFGPNTVLCGRIIRSTEHPKVDWDWLQLGDDTTSEFSGTFPEAVMEGVREC